MDTEDGRIIQECLNGEKEAFGVLIDKYKEGIYGYIYARIGDYQDAQDVAQEVFLKAYQGLRSLKRWESFAFWLYRIAYSRCGQWRREKAKQVDRDFIEDQSPEAVDSPSLNSHRDEKLNESVRDMLDLLPEAYREVLVLHYFAGMSSDEMAASLGTSPTAIRMRLSRARARFKEEMIEMMSRTFEEQRLPMGFTFRIMEAVKRINIQPMPRATALPWGLSLAAGIALVVMTLGSQLSIMYEKPLVEIDVPKINEVSVDVFSGPQVSTIVGQGDIDGKGLDPRSSQNAALLAPAQGGGTWTRKADMPAGRQMAGSAVVDGKIYVIGGAYVDFGFTAVVEEYDPVTNTWTARANMPTARQCVRAAAVDGIIYAIGGWNPSGDLSTVEAYNPKTDKWTRKANMPTARNGPVVVAVDGIIYAIGGNPGIEVTSVVEAYDPARDKWTRKADMPTARFAHAACVIDDRIYISGGCKEFGQNMPDMPTVEVYDPATDTWTQAPDMPMGRQAHPACAVDGKMYIVGGGNVEAYKQFLDGQISQDEFMSFVSMVYVYDPATETWTTAAGMPTARIRHTAAVVDRKIYAIGGVGAEHISLSIVEEFTPGPPHSVSGLRPDGKVPTYWGEVKSDK